MIGGQFYFKFVFFSNRRRLFVRSSYKLKKICKKISDPYRFLKKLLASNNTFKKRFQQKVDQKTQSRSYQGFKGSVSRDFRPPFFHDLNQSRPMIMLRYSVSILPRYSNFKKSFVVCIIPRSQASRCATHSKVIRLKM